MHLLESLLAPGPRPLLVQPGPYPLWRSARAVALPGPPTKRFVGLSLGCWLLRLLRQCVYALLCCWCIHELLD